MCICVLREKQSSDIDAQVAYINRARSEQILSIGSTAFSRREIVDVIVTDDVGHLLHMPVIRSLTWVIIQH